MWLVNLLSCIVFVAFLAREALSVALGTLPSSGQLWRLSIDFGYDLTPFLHLMSGELRLSGGGTIAMLVTVIALIAAGATKREPPLSIPGYSRGNDGRWALLACRCGQSRTS